MPEKPADRVLFTAYAVKLGVAAPEALAAVAERCRDESATTFAELLVQEGVLTADARAQVERALAQSADGRQPTLADPLGGVGDTAVRAPAGAAPQALDPAAAEELRSLMEEEPGRYDIREEEGHGGQARVYLAFDRLMEREVALKVLHGGEAPGAPPSFSSARSTPGAMRFVREARVTGQLEHPNIVPVYEAGRRSDGTLYYTMRLVKGRTLAAVLKESRTLPERLKRLGSFWDVCNAVAFAHSRGVVHRDLKPENIMVGEFGESVLLDWGVAKVRGKRDLRAHELERDALRLAAPSSGQTAQGTAMGTPSYMSPEQAKGQVDQIDDRSDVWGLGAVLYEILTGKPPFLGETPAQTLAMVAEAPLVPARAHCPDAPAELCAIAEKALHKPKEARYQSAKELAAEVEAYMTGGKVRAHHYSSWALLKRFAAQNRAALAAAVAVAASVLAALVLVTLSLRQETAARRGEEAARALEHRERLTASYHLAQAFAERAARLGDERHFLTASVYAAASLSLNPAHPKSATFSPGFAEAVRGSADTSVSAASQIYRSRLHALTSLAWTFRSPDVFERVAFSPNGRFVAGTTENVVRLWDVATGAERRPLEGHTDRAFALAWSADGRSIASGGRDKAVIVWEVATGRPGLTVREHTDVVRSLAFSPDGSRLASGGADGLVFLWDLETGKAVRRIAEHKARITRVAFSPDGELLASSSNDDTVRFWRASDGAPLPGSLTLPAKALDVAFSPDGRTLATGDAGGSVRTFDAATLAPRLVMPGHKNEVEVVAFTPDGATLVSGSLDKTVRFWDARTGEALLTLDAHQNFVYGAAVSSDGKLLATGSWDKTVRVWRLQAAGSLVRLQGHADKVYSLALSQDGKTVASGGWDNALRVWDLASRASRVFAGHTGPLDGTLAFSPDGRRIVSGSKDKTARVWDVATGATLQVLPSALQVYGVSFSPDGAKVATTGYDRRVHLWDVETGRELLSAGPLPDVGHSTAFSPDGKLLAVGVYDKSVTLLDATTGETAARLAGHTDWVTGVHFSPDGKLLASAGKDALAILWDVEHRREHRRLVGHGQWVNSAVFSPDGKYLVTASDDTTVRVWSVASGETLLIVSASSEVTRGLVSPDGRSLVTADGNDVLVYPLDFSALEADPRALLEDAQRRAGVKLVGSEVEPL